MRSAPDEFLKQVSARAPNFWFDVERLRDPADPPWVYVPTERAAKSDRLRGLSENAETLSMLSAWRTTRSIYRFDVTLKEALLKTPVSGLLPAEHLLRLPAWSGFVEGDPAWDYAAGFWWLLDQVDSRPVLRLIPLVWSIADEHGPSFWMPCGEQLVDLSDTVETAAKKHDAASTASRGLPSPAWKPSTQARWDSFITANLGRRLALLLYLCAEDVDLPDAHPAHPSTRRIRQRKDCPTQAVEWDVGVRIGAALRQARSEAAEAAGGTHAAPRAHVRAAHWHSFWTGPRTGEQVLRLRWLSPILVGRGETVTVIRPVRDIGPPAC